MRVAICGYPPLIFQIINGLKNSGIECPHFINDLISIHGEPNSQIPSFFQPISFFEFRRLIESGKLDGLIIADYSRGNFIIDTAKTCKLYDIPNVYLTNLANPYGLLYPLDNEKMLISYLETNLIDSCNLNCKGCTHYASLFTDEDFYKLEDFQRDMKQLAERADILTLRLMGGEPLKLKNLDKYLKIARKFFPHTALRVVTNGLLIPNTPKYISDSLRQNKIVVGISQYPPTLRILDKLTAILKENNVAYSAATGKIETFDTFLSLHGGHNPEKSRMACGNSGCNFLRNGKIYKCPVDALIYKFTEHFGLKGFPAPTGIDILAKNFTSLMEQIQNSTIELCSWCNETTRKIQWTPENNPPITDWLANPAEVENFLPK